MNTRTLGLLPVFAAFISLAIPGTVNSAYAQAVPAAPVENNGKVLAASNAIKLTSPALVSGFGFVSSTPKRFVLPFPGTVRVKWKVKTDASGRNASVRVSSLLETCTAGTNITTTSKALVNGVCDLRVVAGDIVSIAVSGSAPGFFPDMTPGSTGFMKDVSLSFTVQNGTGLGAVLP